MPSLLEQCRALLSETAGQGRPALRSLHHMACSGGTLISRCVAAMPNTQLLSEADPLSPLGPRGNFVPSDMVGLARHSTRPPGPEVLVEIFLAGLDVLHAQARGQGVTLILRDHAHSQFSTGDRLPERPTMVEILRRRYPLLPLVTVRHPIDCFASLQRNGWLHFRPDTLEEYCRRHLAFLDAYEGVPRLRYEDFTAAPEETMQQACTILDLRYNPEFTQLFPALRISGDSGRSGEVIAPRPRRGVGQALREAAADSPSYAALCDLLGYDPTAE